MSKRTTTRTDITDKGFAIAALKAGGLAYEEVGDTTLLIKSGPLANASIDLTNGVISGDTDFRHRSGDAGTLRRDYTEAKQRFLAQRKGHQVKSRVEQKDGSIVLVCRMASHA